MENVFRSERLIYRAIEDTPEDEDFMHTICANEQAHRRYHLSCTPTF